MAIRLQNGVQQIRSFNFESDEDEFYIYFEEDGRANFWSYPIKEDTDIKMYLYEDSTLIEMATNRNKTNRNVLIENRRVKANKKYKIKLKHVGGPIGDYKIKVRQTSVDKGSSNEKFDLGIKRIYYKYTGNPENYGNEHAVISDSYKEAENGTVFELGREIKFKVEVKNYTDFKKPKYKVVVYDEDNNLLDCDLNETPSIRGDKINNAYLYVTIKEPGRQKLKFEIIPEERGWEDEDNKDNCIYREFVWKDSSDINTGDDIKDAQTCLLKIGFNIGKVDGKWGILSTTATKAFQ
ncbi:peptidoglycan-binding domain-containing protein [Caloranaerobacter sp. DY30410]|uniref:peptidoglycan-binding domain-containing protein n=1 Tax=Caloranaerobacter sp. DY30410 TaxID=3238305 RepID=UPI003CFE89EA